MMRRRLFPAIVVAIILLLCACSQDDAMRGRTLSIALEGVAEPGARTILPDSYVQPTKFDVTLTAKEGNGETRTYKDLPLSAGSLTLTDVKLGTYTVSIDGKSDKDAIVMKGTGDTNLVVTPTSVSPVTVTMDVISDSGTGYIKVVFDWSAAKDNARLKSYLATDEGITFKMYKIGDDTTPLGEVTVNGSDTTNATMQFKYPAIKEPIDVYYKLYSGATLITDKLRMSTVYVYAENTSVDDEGVIYLDDSDFSWGVNVRNVTSAYDENSSVVVSWKNVKSLGEQIFDHVVVSYTPTDGGDTKSKTAYFDGKEASTYNTDNDFHFPADSTEGHVILDDLESNVDYDVSIQAWQKDGYVSANAKMTTVTGKVAVSSITPTTTSPISTTAGAEAFTLSWSLNDNASITDVTVKASKDGAFEIGEPNDSTTSGSVSVKPIKAGSYTITVTPEDNKAISTSYTVNTKLATPTGVTAADATDGIKVSWAAVADASSYIVTKYVDDVENGTTTVEGNSWKDTGVFSEKSYSYTVQAIYSSDSNLNSAVSDKSNVIKVPKSAISVTIPESDKDALKIEITSESGVLALYDDDDTLTFSVGEELQGYTYEWILNDLKLTEENASSVKISRAKHGEDFFVNKTGSGEQALMLKITKDSKTYSGYVSFYNVEVPETGVSINLPEGFGDYCTDEGKYRVSSMVDESTVRTVTLTATVEPVGSASVTAVRYSSSNEEIATVNPSTGVVTFKENVHGDVTITATTVGGKTDTVTFEVYNPTVASVEEFINAINSIYGAKLAEADDYFYANPAEVDLYSGWRTSVAEYYLNYDSDGFNFSRMYNGWHWTYSGTEQSSIDSTTASSDAIGDITIKTTGNIALTIEGPDLKNYFVSAIDGGDIEVLLPSNQGMAWLHYNNVSFNSGNQESRDGTFTVTFEKILGYNNEIAKGSRTVDYKENADIDSIHAIVKPGAAS